MCAVDSGSVKPRQSHKTVSCTCCFFHIAKNCFLITMKHDVAWRGESSNKWFFMLINYLRISYVLFVDIFTWSFDHFIWMKFLFAVFLPTSPFIYFGDFCQTPRLLHPPRLLFWPKFASLPVYSALPFYLKLDSNSKRWFSKLKSFLHKFFDFG